MSRKQPKSDEANPRMGAKAYFGTVVAKSIVLRMPRECTRGGNTSFSHTDVAKSMVLRGTVGDVCKHLGGVWKHLGRLT